MYNCPCPEPGYLAEPYHLPGYGGHVPSMRHRNGGSFSRLSRDALEDPCVPQAPIPILQPPMISCRNSCQTNVGCDDLGCCSGFYCPPPRQQVPKSKPVCAPLPCAPCCDPRAHHINRSPYACPCKPEPDTNVYRCCESISSSYTGHVPGFTFHSNGRTFGRATWGTKQYMDKCFYYNTFLQ